MHIIEYFTLSIYNTNLYIYTILQHIQNNAKKTVYTSIKIFNNGGTKESVIKFLSISQLQFLVL